MTQQLCNTTTLKNLTTTHNTGFNNQTMNVINQNVHNSLSSKRHSQVAYYIHNCVLEIINIFKAQEDTL